VARELDGTATYYVFDGEKIARVEQPEAGTRDFYVQEGQSIYSPLVSVHDEAAEAHYWYLFDALGSTMGLADANGNLSGKLQYDAFGNVLAEENVPRSAFFKYVGAYQYMPEQFEDMMLLWHGGHRGTQGTCATSPAEGRNGDGEQQEPSEPRASVSGARAAPGAPGGGLSLWYDPSTGRTATTRLAPHWRPGRARAHAALGTGMPGEMSLSGLNIPPPGPLYDLAFAFVCPPLPWYARCFGGLTKPAWCDKCGKACAMLIPADGTDDSVAALVLCAEREITCRATRGFIF
jgi:hypothetical protein